jgi:hypothetical protein
MSTVRAWPGNTNDKPPQNHLVPAITFPRRVFLLTGKLADWAHIGAVSESSGHRSCKCGAVYDRSEHMVEAREISSFECAVLFDGDRNLAVKIRR